jgi:hypothetical protein
VFQKLDEQTAMHMRTREDLVELKGDVRVLKEQGTRHDERQHEFERTIERKFKEHAENTDAKLGEVSEKVDDLDTELTSIREERIAEKAQWRGPEKVILAIAGLGSAIGAVLAIKELFHF